MLVAADPAAAVAVAPVSVDDVPVAAVRIAGVPVAAVLLPLGVLLVELCPCNWLLQAVRKGSQTFSVPKRSLKARQIASGLKGKLFRWIGTLITV